MTETIEPMVLDEDERQVLAHRLVDQAREEGVDLVGPGGLLTGLTKQVLETALEEEITDHLGYDHGDRDAKTGTNERNGSRAQTVLTEIGPVELDVPRDRVYPVIFIDAIVVKVRDGQVTNKPFYVVIGVTTGGERDILGIWAGDGGEGAKYWLAVLTEIKNRSVEDVCIAVCDGLKGLPDAITTVWEKTQVQTCVIHLIRNTFRYAARQDWDAIAKDLRPIYTAVKDTVAAERLEDFAEHWGAKYPAAVKLWRSAWEEFIPFLDYDVEIRKIICTTNAIESLNARYRRAVRARGHFPNEAAALKCLYLVTRSLDPTGRGRARWVIRWKAALNAFAITFEGRINPSNQ